MLHLHSVQKHTPVLGDAALCLSVVASNNACATAPFGLVDPQATRGADAVAADHQFLDMLNAYRPSGGLLRAPDAAARCKPHGDTDVPTLAGWIVHRKVVSFEWLSRIWLPVFQFNRADMSRHSGLEEVLAELVQVYGDWQIARWFALPNQWLADARPADRLAVAVADVLIAARAERSTPTVSPFFALLNR